MLGVISSIFVGYLDRVNILTRKDRNDFITDVRYRFVVKTVEVKIGLVDCLNLVEHIIKIGIKEVL